MRNFTMSSRNSNRKKLSKGKRSKKRMKRTKRNSEEVTIPIKSRYEQI